MFFNGLSLSLRTLFSHTPSRSPFPYSIFVAQCSTSSPSALTHPHPHSHPDPSNAKVLVCWDLHNCTVPTGVNSFRVVKNITSALKYNGINGPIKITAFVDTFLLPDTTKLALNGTCTELIRIDCDKGYSADHFLDTELKDWTLVNQPPAHILLIGGSKGLAHSLCMLKIDGYNILLAGKESVPVELRRFATIMWDWNALVRGENLTGRCYEGPLEDPSIEIERPAFAPDDQPVELLQHELFSLKSFWRDLQTFMNTPVASFIISHSRTRENLAFLLQEYGPSVLRSVTKRDVLLMVVEMLIFEKKWVDETAYRCKPFKLTSAAQISGQKL